MLGGCELVGLQLAFAAPEDLYRHTLWRAMLFRRVVGSEKVLETGAFHAGELRVTCSFNTMCSLH